LFAHFLGELRQEHPALDTMLKGEGPWRPTVPIWLFVGLLRRSWDGNVREVANVAERVVRVNLQGGAFRAPPELWAVATGTPEPPAARQQPEVATGPELAAASAALGLAHKTVAKLLDAADLAAEGDALRAVASARLIEVLVAHDFVQARVAQQLGTSRTTLAKMMRDLGLPRAVDFDLDGIEAALSAADDDLEAAALTLRVSPRALRKRLTMLRLALKSD
jgi:two-component system nitrogen regulation response regulator GlnG